MARRLRWTEAAWADLEEAADYIARDSPYYAAAFALEVRNAARSLRRFAERGRMVPELADPSIREIFVQGYRLIYLLSSSIVYVVAVIHGARDLREIWEQEGRGGTVGEPSQ